MSIHYKVVGDGYPIVMLHGWTIDHQAILHAMEPTFVKRNGWKRIYIDLPGMGLSPSQSSIQNSDDILEVILNLLDEILPNQPFIICGYSYGGYITRGIIHSRPEQVRGLMLIAPVTVPNFSERIVPPKTILKRDKNLLAKLTPQEADEFSSLGVILGQDEWKRFETEIFLPSKKTNYDFLDKVQQNGYGFTFNISAKFAYPTLIITGRQDHVVGYHDSWRLLEEYPRATFAVLDMAGHNLQIEQTELFNSLVHNWLNRIESEVF